MSTSPVNSSLLTVLTQPGSPLASLNSGPLASVLQNASPQDLVSLSNAALQLQQIGGLFGDELQAQGDSSGSANSLLAVNQTLLQSLEPAQAQSQATDPLTTLSQTLLQALNANQEQTPTPSVNVYG